MEIYYSKLWKHAIQGYGNVLFKAMETYYPRLWKCTIQGYGNILSKAVVIKKVKSGTNNI
jgi:hypothetical protein